MPFQIDGGSDVQPCLAWVETNSGNPMGISVQDHIIGQVLVCISGPLLLVTSTYNNVSYDGIVSALFVQKKAVGMVTRHKQKCCNKTS